jgi:hypothetical protein
MVGMRNLRQFQLPVPPLTVAEILAWADAYRARKGRFPHAFSGAIPEAPLGTNWRQVDNALRYGLRGLAGGASLAQFLAEHRGHRNIQRLPRLTDARIVRWAVAWKRRTGDWPLIGSGSIPESTAGDTWKAVDIALRQGLRGLRPGRSLPQLLAEQRGAAIRTGPRAASSRGC